jgi:hypothetical protein
MKKTDMAMIILIAGVSVLVTYLIANSLPLFKDANKPVSVKVAEKITPDFEKVDTTIFNKDAINPTVEVIIGGNNSSATAQSAGAETQSSQANENQ